FVLTQKLAACAALTAAKPAQPRNKASPALRSAAIRVPDIIALPFSEDLACRRAKRRGHSSRGSRRAQFEASMKQEPCQKACRGLTVSHAAKRAGKAEGRP